MKLREVAEPRSDIEIKKLSGPKTDLSVYKVAHESIQ